MPKEQRFWSLIALGTFVVLGAVSFALVSRYADLTPADLTFFDLAVLGLGTFRLVHLLTYDKIFQVVRDPFMDAKGGRLKKAARGWRRLVCEFLECIWCTGMWSAVFSVTIYFLGIWGRYTVILFAVAGLGSLLQVISKAIAEKR
jgi:Protein of unknown function (DUF1360)